MNAVQDGTNSASKTDTFEPCWPALPSSASPRTSSWAYASGLEGAADDGDEEAGADEDAANEDGNAGEDERNQLAHEWPHCVHWATIESTLSVERGGNKGTRASVRGRTRDENFLAREGYMVKQDKNCAGTTAAAAPERATARDTRQTTATRSSFPPRAAQSRAPSCA